MQHVRIVHRARVFSCFISICETSSKAGNGMSVFAANLMQEFETRGIRCDMETVTRCTTVRDDGGDTS